jgi:hypothetical protein
LRLKYVSPSIVGFLSRTISVPSRNPTHPRNPDISPILSLITLRYWRFGHLIYSFLRSTGAITIRLEYSVTVPFPIPPIHEQIARQMPHYHDNPYVPKWPLIVTILGAGDVEICSGKRISDSTCWNVSLSMRAIWRNSVSLYLRINRWAKSSDFGIDDLGWMYRSI